MSGAFGSGVAARPPGTGLPRLERHLMGRGIRLVARAYVKDRVTAFFREEAERAMALAARLDADQARHPVSIPRMFGIEDNSRHWSVGMALEHLVIVNTAVAALLPRLYSGRAPSTPIRIEDVKPIAGAGLEQIECLAALVERYTDIVEKLGNLRAGSRYPHPWFGALSAAQWHALAAIHNSTHRRQVERIIKLL